MRYDFKSIVGQVVNSSFFDIFFQKNFLKKFNFGYPEILKINFVLKLNKYCKKKGRGN